MSEVMMTVKASRPRLLFGTVLQGVLGALLIHVAFSNPPAAMLWQLFLIVLGALVLWNAVSTWKAGQRTIELTDEVLRDSTGAVICRTDEIEQVSRGALAFKPARGFALLLREPGRRVWVPGLWWRIGRRVGVGGITTAAETRIMAEMIEAMIAARGASIPRKRDF